MSEDFSKIKDRLPHLRGLVDDRVDRELYLAFLKIYEFIKFEVSNLAQVSTKISEARTQEIIEKTTELVNNFAVGLIKGNGNGNNPLQQLGDGTVKSVLSSGNILFNGSGPITESGTLSFTLLSQAMKTVLAGPTSGADASPTFRLLAALDIPVNDFILRDTRASQPAATAVVIGTLYYVTDEGVTERSNGTIWQDYSDIGTGGGGAHATSHENGGTDEINIAGLSGVAADPQVPITENVQDIVGAFVADTAEIDSIYDDSSNSLSLFLRIPGLFQARLTTETGVPVSAADRTAQSSIFITPFKGNRLSIFNGTVWEIYSLSADITLALSGLTSGKNYDVFVFDNAGVVTIELSAAWTDDLTRADALALQDGIKVKSADHTRLYIGSIRTTGTTTIEDSVTKRFLFNEYNQVERNVSKTDTTDNWSYTIATWRQARADANNKVEVLIGSIDRIINVSVLGGVQVASNGSATIHAAVGLGIDSTTVPSGFFTEAFKNDAGGTNMAIICSYRDHLTIGYHALNWLEIGISTGTSTFLGDNGGNCKCGIYGTIWC